MKRYLLFLVLVGFTVVPLSGCKMWMRGDREASVTPWMLIGGIGTAAMTLLMVMECLVHLG